MAGLRLVDDGQHVEPISGRDVMREVGELLVECLPRVPVDDPLYGSLIALRVASGVRQARPT